MTHQTLSLGKYWKLFRATLKSKPIRGQISTTRASGSPSILEYFSLPVHHSVSQSFRQSLSMSIHCLSVSPSVCLSMGSSVHQSFSASIRQSIGASVCLCGFTCLSVSRSVYQSVCQSVSTSTSFPGKKTCWE